MNIIEIIDKLKDVISSNDLQAFRKLIDSLTDNELVELNEFTNVLNTYIKSEIIIRKELKLQEV